MPSQIGGHGDATLAQGRAVAHWQLSAGWTGRTVRRQRRPPHITISAGGRGSFEGLTGAPVDPAPGGDAAGAHE